MPEPGMSVGLLRLVLVALQLAVRVQYPRTLGWPSRKRWALPGDRRVRAAELRRAPGVGARPRGCRQEARACPEQASSEQGSAGFEGQATNGVGRGRGPAV